MSELKDRLRADLTASMKARDALTTGTLRMALTAVTNEEVSGATARDLSDAEVMTVLTREVKKRKEAAEAYDGANRPELAEKERAESAVLGALPAAAADRRGVDRSGGRGGRRGAGVPRLRPDHETDGPGDQGGAGALRRPGRRGQGSRCGPVRAELSRAER